MLRLSCGMRGRIASPKTALRVLNISPSAELTPATVKKAYIQQTLRCHPDLHPTDPDASQKFRELSEALRVVLKALQLHKHRTGGNTELGSTSSSSKSTSCSVGVYDTAEVLEVLRCAIARYHTAKEVETSWRPSSQPASHAATAADRESPFYSPSLEYVTAVCRKEALALRRVRTFCDELPTTLSGSKTVLFDTFAFFHARYVEAMAACVLRFSRSLPIIVNRVVKQRKRHVRYHHTQASEGVGTGSRPRQQKIEDMAMKPLVLVGALIFDRPRGAGGGGGSGANSEDGSDDLHVTSSTQGVMSPQEIQCCPELRCTIHPSDSIDDIVEKIGRWEARSFSRLRVELAIAQAATLLSTMLELGLVPLSVQHNLLLPQGVAERVSLTVQRLVCQLCQYAEHGEAWGCTTEGLPDGGGPHEEVMADATTAASIRACKELAERAAVFIKGPIALRWGEKTPLVTLSEDVTSPKARLAPTFPAADGVSEVGDDDSTPRFQVCRHPSCCSGEMVLYAVSVRLQCDLGPFLANLTDALQTVVSLGEEASAVVPQLVELRLRTTQEEFIPQGHAKAEVPACGTIPPLGTDPLGDSLQLPSAAGETTFTPLENLAGFHPSMAVAPPVDDGRTYTYRGPIHCFPRVFNMPTAKELRLWQLLNEHRMYLASHAPAMNALSIFFNCTPYTATNAPGTVGPAITSGEDVVGGWVGDSGVVGTEDVILTDHELVNEHAFREWLEDVVEQSALNRECQKLLHAAGVGYIQRSGDLPLAHYLSFIKLYVSATAVRSVLEARNTASPSSDAAAPRVLGQEDVGLSIVVGMRCDVRDGGQLFVPWYLDPTALMSLLGDPDGEPVASLADR